MKKRTNDVKKKSTNGVHMKIAGLHEMNTSYLEEIKTLITEEKTAEKFHVISYFTYSLNINHSRDQENFSLGTYHIQNVGEKPLSNPYICIKVSSDSPFKFSGKYLYKGSRQLAGMTNAWERLNDHQDQQEFWLKPAKKNILEPNETLSFSNFQVKWLPEPSYAGSIMGFTYGDEIKDGMSALNQINVSGAIGKEDTNEE